MTDLTPERERASPWAAIIGYARRTPLQGIGYGSPTPLASMAWRCPRLSYPSLQGHRVCCVTRAATVCVGIPNCDNLVRCDAMRCDATADDASVCVAQFLQVCHILDSQNLCAMRRPWQRRAWKNRSMIFFGGAYRAEGPETRTASLCLMLCLCGTATEQTEWGSREEQEEEPGARRPGCPRHVQHTLTALY